MKQIEVLTSLSGGELGPTFYGRFDLPVYAQGVKTMQNFVPLREGGATTIGGSDYIGALSGRCRLEPFIISPDLSYVLVFTPGHLRIWKYGTTDLGIDIITPYSEADLRKLRFCQNTSWFVITTRDHPPKLLRYLGADSFSTDAGALQNYTADLVYTAGRQPFNGAGNYPAVALFFIGRIWFFSSYNKPEGLWASNTFEYKKFVYYEVVTNITTQLKEPASIAFIGTITKDSAVITGTEDLRSTLTTNHYVYGTGVPNGAKVVSVGPYSVTLSKPITETYANIGFNAMLWKTTTPEYETVTTTRDVIIDSSAMEFELGSDQNDTIIWAVARKDLVIGTTSSEWVIPGNITATNIKALLETRNGSGDVQAFFLGDAAIFATGNKKALREYVYNTNSDGYQSPELTFLAPHIAQAGIVELDWQNNPRTTIWAVLEDGTVAIAAYERIYATRGWSRVVIPGGLVESVAIIPGQNGDEVYASINRGGARKMERMAQIFSNSLLSAAVTKTKTSGGVTGVTHISGPASVFYNGSYYPVTVSAGAAALPSDIPDGASVSVGLQMEAKIAILRPNVQSRFGTAQARIKTINAIGLRLLNSGRFRVVGGAGSEDSAEAPGFTGDTSTNVRGTWDLDGWAEIVTNEAMTILAVFCEVNAGG